MKTRLRTRGHLNSEPLERREPTSANRLAGSPRNTPLSGDNVRRSAAGISQPCANWLLVLNVLTAVLFAACAVMLGTATAEAASPTTKTVYFVNKSGAAVTIQYKLDGRDSILKLGILPGGRTSISYNRLLKARATATGLNASGWHQPNAGATYYVKRINNGLVLQQWP